MHDVFSLLFPSVPLPIRSQFYNISLITIVKVVIIPLSSKEVNPRVLNSFGRSSCDSSDLLDRCSFTSNRQSRQYCRCFRRWRINGCLRGARSSYGSIAHNVGCGILILDHLPWSIAFENRYLIHYEESTRAKSPGSAAAATTAEDASRAATKTASSTATSLMLCATKIAVIAEYKIKPSLPAND